MTGKRKKAVQLLPGKANAQVRDEVLGEHKRKMPDVNMAELLHELQVHQVELETQNEELRQAQADILSSRQRFADLFHRAPVGYLVLDQTGLVQDANETFCQLTGRVAKSIKNRSFFDLIAASDRAWFMARYKALYKKPERKNIELGLLTGENRTLFVSLDAVLHEAAEVNSGDSVSRLLLTVSDISERKRAEQALQAQTDLLATVFESSPNILILVDADGRVEKINRTGSEFAGNTPEQLIGMLGGEVLHCFNAYKGKGCGRNPECNLCPIRTRVARSLESEETILNEEGRLTVWKGAQEVNLDFLISTVPVKIDGIAKVLVTIVDVTERKRKDERIRYQAYLLENVSDAILSADEDFVIQSWNRAAEEMYGWKEQEVLGKTVEEVLKPKCNQPLKQVIENFHRQGSWTGEGIHYRRNGEPITVFSSIRLIGDKGENPVRVIATYRDISESKRAEEALRQSELQYRTILRTALDGFWIIDPDSNRILDVNDAYCQMSGYSREEILQMTIGDLEAIETAENTIGHPQKILESGSGRFESEHKRKDGSTFQVEVSVQSLRDDGGRHFAFIHDVTARKQAKDALQKSEEQYRLLFDEMLSGFALHEIICDERGHPVDYRFLAVNTAFEELTGLKIENLIGHTVLEVLPETEPFWIERYGRVALEGVSDEFSGFNAAIGKYYEARAYCPEPGKFAVMFHDVTERKQAEENLKRLLHEKEILLAEVHHRVKNNMQIITSLLGLQARDTEDKRLLAAIDESRQRIHSMALVHEQLYRAGEYAKIDFGNYVDQLASTLFNIYQVDSKQVDLQIEGNKEYLDLEKAIPCGLLLNELVTNSLKYAFPNDRKGKLFIGLKRQLHRAILTVSDDGVGIPENFDLKSAHSLGLQLVNMLSVHDLQGSIVLEKKNGTHFRIEFPL